MKRIIYGLFGIALIGLAIHSWGKQLTIVEDAIIMAHAPQAANGSYAGAKQVEGNHYYPYLSGNNIDEAIFNALEKAGPEYDMLIDATIDVKYYYLFVYFSDFITVKGTAVNTQKLKEEMNTTEYTEYLKGKNVIYAKNPLKE